MKPRRIRKNIEDKIIDQPWIDAGRKGYKTKVVTHIAHQIDEQIGPFRFKRRSVDAFSATNRTEQGRRDATGVLGWDRGGPGGTVPPSSGD